MSVLHVCAIGLARARVRKYEKISVGSLERKLSIHYDVSRHYLTAKTRMLCRDYFAITPECWQSMPVLGPVYMISLTRD